MRRTMHISIAVRCMACLYLTISWSWMIYAQDTQPQGQIFLPPAAGGTRYSFAVEAEAKYIAAQGAFLESAAIARKINAEAVALEIQNSVNYVNAYFKRQELNKEWRHKLNPLEYESHLEMQKKLKEVMAQRIDQYFIDTLKGDVTAELNYMLQALYFVQYMSPGDLEPLDSQLTKDQLKQIFVTDGGPGNSKLVFTLGNGEILKMPWPYALRGSQFQAERNNYELSREALIKEIQEKGRASPENGEQLRKSVIQLWAALETAYPEEKRMEPAVFLEYNSAKGFLQSTLVQVNRAVTTNDDSIFKGSSIFNGETLLGLLQHMSKRGLMFDRPQPGGEGVYHSLFTDMRELYLKLAPEKKEGGGSPAKK